MYIYIYIYISIYIYIYIYTQERFSSMAVCGNNNQGRELLNIFLRNFTRAYFNSRPV